MLECTGSKACLLERIFIPVVLSKSKLATLGDVRYVSPRYVTDEAELLIAYRETYDASRLKLVERGCADAVP